MFQSLQRKMSYILSSEASSWLCLALGEERKWENLSSKMQAVHNAPFVIQHPSPTPIFLRPLMETHACYDPAAIIICHFQPWTFLGLCTANKLFLILIPSYTATWIAQLLFSFIICTFLFSYCFLLVVFWDGTWEKN
jgi:hypothetical protein